MGRPINTQNDFWSQVNIGNLDDCWLWQGALSDKNGYGQFMMNHKRYMAHRMSWELVNGKILNNLQVLHDPIKCKNKSCVNPNHLRLGTDADNHHDPDIAILDWNKVTSIREKYSTGEYTYKELSLEYTVSLETIYDVVNYRTWKN